MRLFNYVPTIVAKQHASLPTCDSRPHFFAVRPIGAPFEIGRFMGDFGKLLESKSPDFGATRTH